MTFHGLLNENVNAARKQSCKDRKKAAPSLMSILLFWPSDYKTQDKICSITQLMNTKKVFLTVI